MTQTRTCRNCGEAKPLSHRHYEQHFGEWKTWCRECRGKQLRCDGESCRCTACGERKPLAAFYPKRLDWSNNCKECENARRYRNRKKAALGVLA